VIDASPSSTPAVSILSGWYRDRLKAGESHSVPADATAQECCGVATD